MCRACQKILYIGVSVCCILAAQGYFGQPEGSLPPEDVVTGMKIFFAGVQLYNLSATFIKVGFGCNATGSITLSSVQSD